MDAKDFIRDFYRMCECTDDCSQCGLEETNCDITNRHATNAEIEKTIEVVEEWGKTHPIKTNIETHKNLMLRLLPKPATWYAYDVGIHGDSFFNITVPYEWWKSEFTGVEYD